MKSVRYLLILSYVVVLSSPMRLSKTHDQVSSKLPAVRHEVVRDERQYAFRYITADNTVVSERGRLVPTHTGEYVMEIEGKYGYIGDDGHYYFTKYRGGINGFQVEAAHLPRPVPAQRAVRNKMM